MTRAPKRSSDAVTLSPHPTAGHGLPTTSISSARGCASPGVDSHTIPAPARIAAVAASEAAPVMPGLPATTRTARVHLWASTGRGRHQPATSTRLDDVGPRRRHVEADVGDGDRCRRGVCRR